MADDWAADHFSELCQQHPHILRFLQRPNRPYPRPQPSLRTNVRYAIEAELEAEAARWQRA